MNGFFGIALSKNICLGETLANYIIRIAWGLRHELSAGRLLPIERGRGYAALPHAAHSLFRYTTSILSDSEDRSSSRRDRYNLVPHHGISQDGPSSADCSLAPPMISQTNSAIRNRDHTQHPRERAADEMRYGVYDSNLPRPELICLATSLQDAHVKEGTTLQNSASPTLALIHTSPTLTPAFAALCRQHVPEAKLFHMVDESLIQETIRAGHLRKPTVRRLVTQIASAESAGADAVLVTCSSIGPGVTLAGHLFDIPVIRIDDAMAEAAVRQAKRIGVLATLRTTLDPTTALLNQKAAEAYREVELIEGLCADAFPAVLAGDTEKHDSILRKALLEDLKDVDAIVLAQASMARVVATLAPGALRVPVYSSPELAVLSARQALNLPNKG